MHLPRYIIIVHQPLVYASYINISRLDHPLDRRSTGDRCISDRVACEFSSFNNGVDLLSLLQLLRKNREKGRERERERMLDTKKENVRRAKGKQKKKTEG